MDVSRGLGILDHDRRDQFLDQGLRLADGQVADPDVTGNTALESLVCQSNQGTRMAHREGAGTYLRLDLSG